MAFILVFIGFILLNRKNTKIIKEQNKTISLVAVISMLASEHHYFKNRV